MSKLELSKENIEGILEAKRPKSLTEIYRHLGGVGKLSGSTGKQMRTLVPDIEKVVAGNRAGKGKGEPRETLRTSGKSKKPGRQPSAKNEIPRHPKNPFRAGSGYGLLIDLIAHAGEKGIGKEVLLDQYCRLKKKPMQLAKYDLSVINSGVLGCTKHRSMRDGVTIIRDIDNYRVRFE